MNDFSDADITSALQTLPDPPAHAANFWDQLEQQLETAVPAAPPSTNRTNGRARFLLVAAALVAVAGAIGIAVNNSSVDTVDLADTPVTSTPEPTTPPPTTPPTTEAESPSDPAFADADRVVSEIFRYDVAIPADFTLESSSGRQIYIVATDDVADDDDQLNTALSVSNFFSDNEEWRRQIEANDFQPLLAQSTVEVPLYTETNGTISLSANTISAEQYVFGIPEFGQRIVRVFKFEDRTIVVELSDAAPGLVDSDLASLLDGVRLYEGPAAAPTTCSSNGLAVLEAPSELNDAQRTRFNAIVTALVTCDWDLLEAQMDPGGFMPTVGGGDAIEIWQNNERYGSSILRALYDHLAFPVGGNDEGASWPQGWDNPDGFNDATLEALLASEYYDETSLEIWDETTYLGFRTGISEEGVWSYFLAGD